MSHNFIIGPTDTDSISFCKPDGLPFTNQELLVLMDEIAFLSPEYMDWDLEGVFSSCLAIKAKNYILLNGEDKKVKGSAFKSSNKEPALRELMDKLVDILLKDGTTSDCISLYESYIKESMNIKDISRWATKKTITKAVLTGERKNETKVLEAIGNDHVNEGDKIWVYNALDGEIQASAKGVPTTYADGTPKMIPNAILKQTKNWTQDHDPLHYAERVYDTISILSTVLDMSLFIKYHSKKNKNLLDELCKNG